MNAVIDESAAEGEAASRTPVRRLDATEGDDDEEDSMAGNVLHAYLRAPSCSSDKKCNLAGLWKTFSMIAWCGKSNLIACVTEECMKDLSYESHHAFWIPVHIVNPERPTEHTLLSVTAESPSDYIQFLEWSPVLCQRALLIGTSSGRMTIWTQSANGGPNVARAINCWNCEHKWQQDQAIACKWLFGVFPYRWSAATTSVLSKAAVEDRFISHQTRAPARWPNFLCVCSVFTSGTVQLHWCQWPPLSSQKWFCTSKGMLGAGPSGLLCADAIVNEAGALLVGGVPMGNPWNVVIWEVSPFSRTSQATCKASMNNQSSSQGLSPSWPGVATLPAFLLSFYEANMKETSQNLGISGLPGEGKAVQDIKLQQSSMDAFDAGEFPLLQCSPVSNLSVYVTPEASQFATMDLGSGVDAVAFDPSKGGSSLAVLIVEGQYFLPHPEDGPALMGYKVQQWESLRQPVSIHPLFELGLSNFSAALHSTATVWKSTMERSIPTLKSPGGNTWSVDGNSESYGNGKSTTIGSRLKLTFSACGGELAAATPCGGVHIYCASTLTALDSYYLSGGTLSAVPAFSPTGCCLGTVWHDLKKDCSVLKIIRVSPPALLTTNSTSASLERGLADRFWWSLVSDVDWWDVVGCTQSVVEDNLVTFPKVIAVLDSDFHSLPMVHRQYYGSALDRIKCRMLEGVDGSDVRAAVLDMQARLLLEMLGKGIEASLTNPGTFLSEPWTASSETLAGLVPDAMAVEPTLVHYIQFYVDALLDLASHFLTRLRRYATICKQLAGAGSSIPTIATARLPNTSTNGSNQASTQGTQGSSTSASGNSSTAVQAWVQGAIAKANTSTEGATSLSSTAVIGTVPPLQLNVSQAAFPGMPAVRLIGDCNFLHRLCQLLLFCLIFRRRQPAHIAPSMDGPDEISGGRPQRLGNGNAGQGYTPEEVKFLFLVSASLCKKTSTLPHPMPKSQVGLPTPAIRLHYPDGEYSVAPEVVEASLGIHVQSLPRPRGADSAGLLMRELELHPPSEDWSKRNFFWGPWTGSVEPVTSEERMDFYEPELEFFTQEPSVFQELWPRKRRFSERDTAFGLKTGVGLGSFLGFMGSRRDTITAAWKNSIQGIWHKCIRCGRQTGALATPSTTPGNVSPDAWWTARWAHGCPMCGGSWLRIV